MGIFGEVEIPVSKTNLTILTVVREESPWDNFLNHFFAGHCILVFAVSLCLLPLIILYHSRQKRSISITLFLCVNCIDLIRSVYTPAILLPKLLSRDLDPFWEVNYTGWVGYVNNILPLLTDIEFILLVTMCAVRYSGVKHPHKSPRPLALTTAVVVVLRVLLFASETVFMMTYKYPTVKMRLSQLIYIVSPEYNYDVTRMFTNVKHMVNAIVLMIGVVMSSLTIHYMKTLQKTVKTGSKRAEARNKRSITIIIVMNIFSVLVTAFILVRAVMLFVPPKFSPGDNFITYASAQGMPLTQSLFNCVIFVCVSSSFRSFVRKLTKGTASVSTLSLDDKTKRSARNYDKDTAVNLV